MAYPSDLVRTKNWGNEVMTDADLEGQFDLIVAWVMAALNATTGHKHDATQNEGPKILINNLDIASAAEGDVIFRNATVWARLAKGTAYQILRMNSGATAPEWATAFKDMIMRGFELTYKTAADLYVEPGTLLNNTTLINTTARTTLTLATAADWWDGAVDSYVGGAGWCYIGVDVSGNIKLLGANPPDKADAAGNSVGTLLYWYDSTLYWRVIGAVWVHTDNTITKKWFQRGNFIMWDVPVSVIAAISSGAWSGALSLAAAMPGISQHAIFGIMVDGGNGTNGSCWLRPNGSTWSGGGSHFENAVMFVSDGSNIGTGQRTCLTDSSQRIQHYSEASTAGIQVDVEGYYLTIR